MAANKSENNQSQNSLQSDIRVLSAALETYQDFIDKETERNRVLQEKVIVIDTRCKEKCHVYDKDIEGTATLSETLQEVKRRIEVNTGRLTKLEGADTDLWVEVNKLKEHRMGDKQNAIDKLEREKGEVQQYAYTTFWKIITIMVGVISIAAPILTTIIMN